MADEPTPADTAGELWDDILGLARGLSAEDWSRPTPCSDWDVHDLLGHLSGVQLLFDRGVLPDPPPGWEPPADAAPLDGATAALAATRRSWSGERILAELEEARAAHLQRLGSVTDWSAAAQGPLGPTDEDGLFRVRMYDLWVHLADLRTALGHQVPAPDRSAAAAVAHRYVWDRVPWLYARRAQAPEGSTMRVALSAPLDVDTVVEVHEGRGRLNPSADPGECQVFGDPVAFTLLVSGRGEPQEWRERSASDGDGAGPLLDWAGVRGEEFVERARLF